MVSSGTLIDVNASSTLWFHEPSIRAHSTRLRTTSGAAGIFLTCDMTRTAQQFLFITERFVVLNRAPHAIVAIIAIITGALSITFSGTVAFARAIAVTIGAEITIRTEMIRWTTNSSFAHTKPRMQIRMRILMFREPTVQLWLVLVGQFMALIFAVWNVKTQSLLNFD